jgi:hypothetical protein
MGPNSSCVMPRSTCSVTAVPSSPRMRSFATSMLLTDPCMPSMSSKTSPRHIPAAAAGEPGQTCATTRRPSSVWSSTMPTPLSGRGAGPTLLLGPCDDLLPELRSPGGRKRLTLRMPAKVSETAAARSASRCLPCAYALLPAMRVCPPSSDVAGFFFVLNPKRAVHESPNPSNERSSLDFLGKKNPVSHTSNKHTGTAVINTHIGGTSSSSRTAL